MHIHLMLNEKFTEKFVWLIDNYYAPGSNLIYIYNNSNRYVTINSPNIIFINSFDEIDFSLLGIRDKIFVHGFYHRGLVRFLSIFHKKYNEDQLVLIIYGADLYNAREVLKKAGLHLKVRINEVFKRSLIKRCHIYMTFASSDFDLICKWYGAVGKQYDCIYPTNADINYLNMLINTKKKNDRIRVLLGNSAAKSNCHCEAIDVMKDLVEDNMEVICPLSYGCTDELYIKKVRDYGYSQLKNAFIPIFDYLTPDEYSKLLYSIDIAVFNNNRQQATGNIEILMYLGKKIFIRSDTTTWSHYVVRDKCVFYDTKQIDNMTSEQFKEISDKAILYNKEYVKNVWDVNTIKSLWDKVMDC